MGLAGALPQKLSWASNSAPGYSVRLLPGGFRWPSPDILHPGARVQALGARQGYVCLKRRRPLMTSVGTLQNPPDCEPAFGNELEGLVLTGHPRLIPLRLGRRTGLAASTMISLPTRSSPISTAFPASNFHCLNTLGHDSSTISIRHQFHRIDKLTTTKKAVPPHS